MDEGTLWTEPKDGEEVPKSEVVLEFPVEISVGGGLSEDDMQALESRIWESLKEALS